MNREEGTMAPILSATDEESLDRHGSGLARKREHIGVSKPFCMNRLAALDVGERAQPVAVHCCKLKILTFGRLSHRSRQACLDARRFTGEEFLGLGDPLTIILVADTPDARC